MALLKPKPDINKKEIRLGEEKLKSIVGNKLVKNIMFIKLLKANGISNTSRTWSKINSQVKHEIKSGMLSHGEVEERINQLIVMESPYDRLITLDESEAGKVDEAKMEILSEGSMAIQIPYQTSGVGDVAIGAAVLGKNGAILGALNEGATKWKNSKLQFMDNNISLITGEAILYEDIKSVVTGERGFAFTTVTVIKNNGECLIFKAATIKAYAAKSIIEDHLESPSNDNISQLNDNADVLLKYADLYERGLISREEFDEKKQQIFESKNDNDGPSFCGNCGAGLEKGAKFCSNCGSKIKQ